MTESATTTVKEYFHAKRENILWPLVFLLSLSMIGLHFPLGYLLAPLVLINRFQKDKYDFIIMLTLMMDGYGLFTTEDILIKPYNIAALLSIICLFIVKKPVLYKKIVTAIVLYGICLLAFCMLSDEPLKSQIYGVRNHLTICYLFVPIAVFSGEHFEIKKLFEHALIYVLIISWFYIIDSIILGGYLLIPKSIAGWGESSTFYHLNIEPISNIFFRRPAKTLFIISLCIYPVARYYRLSRTYWIVLALALLVSRTFSLIVALVVVFLLCQGNFKKLWQYAIIGIIGFTGLYFVDKALTGDNEIVEVNELGEAEKRTVLRIKSHVDQIIDLFSGNLDEEDAAALGTSRGAQIIPKVELLYDLGKEWTGFGFLDRERTTNQKYIIENDLYTDVELSEEVAIGVEVIPVEIFLTIGYLGLIIHCIFYIYLWWLIRRLKYAGYALSVAGFFIIIGISGFGGLVVTYSLVFVSLAYAAVLLTNKDEIKSSERKRRKSPLQF